MEYEQKKNDSFDLSEAAVLRAYFEKQITAIEFILKKRHSKIAEEDIHKLRVAIKKIKSFSKLILFCVPDFNSKKFLKEYNQIFKIAGKVRELQLEISMLKKFHLLHSIKNYTDHLKKALKKKKHLLFSIANTAMVYKLEKKYELIFPCFNRVSTNKVKQFLDKKSSGIRKLMETGNLKKEEAHRLRKVLKEFYYTLLIFCEKDDRFKYLDEFQELLGQWHNDVVLKDYLKEAEKSEYLNNKESNIIKVVKEKISCESKTLFAKINQKVRNRNELQWMSAIACNL